MKTTDIQACHDDDFDRVSAQVSFVQYSGVRTSCWVDGCDVDGHKKLSKERKNSGRVFFLGKKSPAGNRTRIAWVRQVRI